MFAIWLEIAYSRTLLGFLGGIFPPNDVINCPVPQKDRPCVDTRRLSHSA